MLEPAIITPPSEAGRKVSYSAVLTRIITDPARPRLLIRRTDSRPDGAIIRRHFPRVLQLIAQTTPVEDHYPRGRRASSVLQDRGHLFRRHVLTPIRELNYRPDAPPLPFLTLDSQMSTKPGGLS